MSLERIAAYKREFVEHRKKAVPPECLKAQIAQMPPARDFQRAISRTNAIRIIAETKKASPSKGVLREHYDPVEIARSYERHHADAISVLTDEQFFHGSLLHLTDARAATSLPLLRKDFVIDPYQIYEARAAGADAVLLIVALLDKPELDDYIKLTYECGMKALVEVHTAAEADLALSCGVTIFGINNRDLDTLHTDIAVTEKLLPLLPRDSIIVSESGISSRHDVQYLDALGIDAILVGEHLMRYDDPGLGIAELRG